MNANESNFLGRHWRCLTPGVHLDIEITVHHMMIRSHSLNGDQVSQSFPRPGYHWFDALKLIMLMVGPNQTF